MFYTLPFTVCASCWEYKSSIINCNSGLQDATSLDSGLSGETLPSYTYDTSGILSHLPSVNKQQIIDGATA